MRTMIAQFTGTCIHCGKEIAVGDLIAKRKTFQTHAACHKEYLKSEAHKARERFSLSEPTQTASSGGGISEAEVRAIVAEAVEAVQEPDMEELMALVKGEVAKRVQPREIVVKVEHENGASVKIEGAHFYFDRLVRLLRAGVSVYLYGPAGTGKTTALLMAAQALARECEIDTLDPSTFRSMIQGYMTPTGEPVHTTFTRCWTEGKIYIADECDNAPGHVQTLFNSALANGKASLPWGNISAKEGFAFGAAGNTPFRPTREFPDRRPGSAAFTDRLYFMYWPLDPSIECRAAGLECPPPPTRSQGKATPAQWTAWVQTLRGWAATNMPTLMITPRASLLGAKALAAGESPMEVADGLIFRGCDAEMKGKALSACPLPS